MQHYSIKSKYCSESELPWWIFAFSECFLFLYTFLGNGKYVQRFFEIEICINTNGITTYKAKTEVISF